MISYGLSEDKLQNGITTVVYQLLNTDGELPLSAKEKHYKG